MPKQDGTFPMHADKLPITGPCPIDLDAIGFDRDAKVAHCTHCTKNVHVLSNMTRGQARQFLRDNKGRKMCVSYARDADGRIRFAPDPVAAPVAPPLVPVTRLFRRPSRAVGLATALGMGAALAACTPVGQPPAEVEPTVVQTAPTKPGKTVPEILEVVVPSRPDPIPLAGAAVIPEDLVDGEMEIPDPDAVELDEPCDGGRRADPPKTGPAPVVPAGTKRGMVAL